MAEVDLTGLRLALMTDGTVKAFRVEDSDIRKAEEELKAAGQNPNHVDPHARAMVDMCKSLNINMWVEPTNCHTIVVDATVWISESVKIRKAYDEMVTLALKHSTYPFNVS